MLQSKLVCPYFVGRLVFIFCTPCCTDLVYSFLPRLSSAPAFSNELWPNIRWKVAVVLGALPISACCPATVTTRLSMSMIRTC